jgi:hypothetical protein
LLSAVVFGLSPVHGKSPDGMRQGLGKIRLLREWSSGYSKEIPSPDAIRADLTSLMMRTIICTKPINHRLRKVKECARLMAFQHPEHDFPCRLNFAFAIP